MYNNSDFERFFIRYKSKVVTSKESIQSFCLRNKVPYNLFEKWYKVTRHKLVPVKVEGHLDSGESNGYNVYMYLDDELIDTEHLCFLSHARAKFKYASEQGGGKDAVFFWMLLENCTG